MLSGVRVLLRVARAGAGHASECMRVADQVFERVGLVVVHGSQPLGPFVR